MASQDETGEAEGQAREMVDGQGMMIVGLDDDDEASPPISPYT